MNINLIRGASERDKSEYIIEKIFEKYNQGRQVYLIVPEQYTLEAEKVLIEKTGLDGLLGIQVLSFTSLSSNLLKEVGGANKPMIDDRSKSMVLRKLLSKNDMELELYKRVSKEDGFLKKLNSLISEFKSQNIRSENLLHIKESMDMNPLLERKIDETSRIYEKFNEYLKGRYIDQEDAMDIMNERMEKSQKLRGGVFFIDKFNGFSEQMYQAIGKLCIMGSEVYVSANTKPAYGYIENIFENGEYIARRIEEIADASNSKLTTIDVAESSFQHPEIEFLKKNIFREKTDSWPKKTESVELFCAQTPMDEIEEVAIRINDLVRNKNIRYKEIIVACNEMGNYESAVKRIFSQYEIPYFRDEKRDIMNNPIIVFILSSLECIVKNYSYEPLAKLLKTGFAGPGDDEIEIFENYLIRYGIKGDRIKKVFEWGEEEELKRLNEIREGFIGPLSRLHQNLKSKRSVMQKTRYLYEYLEEMKIYEKLEAWMDELRVMDQYEHLSENSQIWNLIIENMDKMVEILGDESISVKDYHRVLKSGFDSCEVGIIPTRFDEVLVTDIERVKFHERKAVFFIGMNDGIIPKDYKSEAIFLDEEKDLLSKMNIRLVNQKRFKSIEEKFNFYSIISRVKEKLFFSYSISDNDYKALRPSYYLNQIKRIMNLQVKTCMENEFVKDQRFIVTAKASKKHMINAMRMFLDGKSEIKKEWIELYKWYQKYEKDQVDQVKSGIFHDNQVEYIKKSTSYDLYTSPFCSSVSRLELFASCPFAHFVRYGLNLKERKTHEIKSPQMGEFFHETIREFAEGLRADGLSWGELDRDRIDGLVEKIVDSKMEDYENGLFGSSKKNMYTASRIKRISKRAINVLSTQMGGTSFKNVGNEISFGYADSKYPPIEVELEDKSRIYLQGVIDRIDIYKEGQEEFIKIIDYKSSEKNIDLNRLYHGLQLQLMLYMYAVLNKDEKKRPAGIFYFKIDDPMINSQEEIREVIEGEISKKLKMKGIVINDINIIKNLDPNIEKSSSIIPVEINKAGDVSKRSSSLENEEFEYIIKHIDALVKTMGQEILSGKICINPVKIKNETACDYCAYKNICQFDTDMDKNEYKSIKIMKKDEIIKKIKSEIGVEEDE